MADEPAPVFACWNGIIAVRADPFLPLTLRTGQLSTSAFKRPLAATHPTYPRPSNMTPALTPPLRFRASEPDECFSSESFLLPYDLRRQFEMENIYVNPRVINSYSWDYYVWFKYITRHWAVKWWIETVENGNGMHLAKMVLFDPARVWQWDGGECHPVRVSFPLRSLLVLTVEVVVISKSRWTHRWTKYFYADAVATLYVAIYSSHHFQDVVRTDSSDSSYYSTPVQVRSRRRRPGMHCQCTTFSHYFSKISPRIFGRNFFFAFESLERSKVQKLITFKFKDSLLECQSNRMDFRHEISV
jgi:hypothetical protein